MEIGFDFSEVNALVADLGQVPAVAGGYINSAVQNTSRKVKDGAAEKLRKRKHFKQAARTIDYELTVFRGFGASVLQSEIGYNEDRGAAAELGNLAEFGAPGSRNALTPGNELITSLHEQEDDFVEGLRKAGQDALEEVINGSTVRGNVRQVFNGRLI